MQSRVKVNCTVYSEIKDVNVTSKAKILRILKKGNIGIANMHKKYRRQDRDPGWLGHILARGCSDICTSTRKTYQHKPYIVAEVLQH